MKIHYTKESLESLRESLNFISDRVSTEKLEEIRNGIINRVEKLVLHPNIGQKEEYLESVQLGHRRVIEGNHKIIYRLEGEIIYITDIFDTRQDPEKMKG